MSRSLRNSLAILAIAALLVLLVAGVVACGSEETTTTAAPVTTAAPGTTEASATTLAPSTTTSGTVAITGSVDNPLTLTVDDLKKMTVKTITAEHPKKGATEYTGVLISDLMTAVGVQSSATVLDMGCTDGYMAEVTLAELDPNSMLSIGDDGILSAVMPGQTGKAWASDIITMQFK